MFSVYIVCIVYSSTFCLLFDKSRGVVCFFEYEMFAFDLQPNSFIQCPKIRNVSILYIAGYTGAYTGQVSLGGGASRLQFHRYPSIFSFKLFAFISPFYAFCAWPLVKGGRPNISSPYAKSCVRRVNIILRRKFIKMIKVYYHTGTLLCKFIHRYIGYRALLLILLTTVIKI